MCGIGKRKHNRYGSLWGGNIRKIKGCMSCVVCREDRARVLETNKQSNAVERPLHARKPVTRSGKGKPAVYCKKSKWQEAATQAD